MSPVRRFLPFLVLAVILVGIALDFWNRSEPSGIDFHTYAAAARVGVEQGWSHIYDQARVAVEQKRLVPGEAAQPYLSPPTVAWLAAPLEPLPYQPAYVIWAAVTLAALAAAMAWATLERGLARWILVAAAITPWWVPEAIHVGQVVPLVAAGVAVTWRLLREDRNVAAGLALSLLFLKPNTGFLVPLVLLAAGRYRTFATFSLVGAGLSVAALLVLGPDGIAAYLGQLTGPLPSGANNLTLERALGVGVPVASVLRMAIIAIALVAAFRLRGSPGLVVMIGILGSLLTIPYLHASDFCLLIVAALIAWGERPVSAWRVPLAAGWLLASPFAVLVRLDPKLNRWPLLEIVFLAALVVVAAQVHRERPAGEVAGAAS